MRPLVGNVCLGPQRKYKRFFRLKHVSRMRNALNCYAFYVLSACKFTTHICLTLVFVSQPDIF